MRFALNLLSTLDPGSAVFLLREKGERHASARHIGTKAKQFAF